jgi:peptidoglycan/LPS O-acetylase OafA/YrhL
MPVEVITMKRVPSGRENNFNLLRIIAAGAVLVSHAYPISSGPATVEPLSRVLGMSLGTLAVLTFFSISGYFISLSFHNRRSVVEFTVARALRIYPGLLWVLVLTAVVLGPAFTKYDLAGYFLDRGTLLYVPKNLMLWPLQYELPGVFDENAYPRAINGSLWSLVYEVACYAMVAIVGMLGLASNGRRFTGFLVAYGVFYVAAIPILQSDYAHLTIVRNLHLLTLPFVIGMTLFQFRHRVPLRLSVLVALAAASAISYGRPWSQELFILAWSYGILYLGFLRYRPLLAYNRLGDYSYGMYIYAFPVEQVLKAVYSGLTPVVMITLSMPLTLLLAIVSWHCVEERAVGQKLAVAAWLTRNASSPYLRPSPYQEGDLQS